MFELDENQKMIVHYLRTKGSLEKEAADLIESLADQIISMEWSERDSLD